jgi:hypothetical protein
MAPLPDTLQEPRELRSSDARRARQPHRGPPEPPRAPRRRWRRRAAALGGPKLAEARKAATASIRVLADRHAANVLPIIREIQRAGATSPHHADMRAKKMCSGLTPSRHGWFRIFAAHIAAPSPISLNALSCFDDLS